MPASDHGSPFQGPPAITTLPVSSLFSRGETDVELALDKVELLIFRRPGRGWEPRRRSSELSAGASAIHPNQSISRSVLVAGSTHAPLQAAVDIAG
jgi:hypothetical protein